MFGQVFFAVTLIIGYRCYCGNSQQTSAAFSTKPQAPTYQRGKMGTVGAVAVDSEGNIACATSTGGILNKMEGRVGDTACIGSGGYADNNVGAVSTTGHGEAIMKVTLARLILFHMEQGKSVEAASDLALDYMKSRVGGLGGVVTVDPQGHWAARFSSLQMIWAAAQNDTLHYGLYSGEHFTQSINDPH